MLVVSSFHVDYRETLCYDLTFFHVSKKEKNLIVYIYICIYIYIFLSFPFLFF